MPLKQQKSNISSSNDHYVYLVIFSVLVVSLVAFAFLSPINFGQDITGFQSLSLEQTSPYVTVVSFFVLLFGVALLVLFTFRLMSRVL